MPTNRLMAAHNAIQQSGRVDNNVRQEVERALHVLRYLMEYVPADRDAAWQRDSKEGN